MRTSAHLKNQRSALVRERDQLLNVDSDVDFTPAMEARCAQLNADIKDLDVRIGEAVDLEHRDDLARTAERSVNLSTEERAGGVTRTDAPVRRNAAGIALEVQDRARPEVYRRDGQHSFFRDILEAQLRQDRDAWQRLNDNQAAQSRALSTVTGAGGSFAPPAWLVEDYIKLARPARVVADIVNRQPLPESGSSINLPRVATGTAVGITATQNTTITNTDMTTDSVSSSIATIAGGQVLSLELLRQAGAAMDRVVLEDLALATAAMLEQQVIAGSGSSGQLLGLGNIGGTNSVAFTTASPALTSTTTANSLHYALVKAINAVSTGRLLPPDAIVMHPRRWAWVSTQLDTTNRPIVAASQSGGVMNAPGAVETVAAAGRVGTLAGLPVYVSAQIPTNLGAGTNQDEIFVLRTGDAHLFESELDFRTFDQVLAQQNSLYVRAFEWAAFIGGRYPKSISVITGTGLVDPGL